MDTKGEDSSKREDNICGLIMPIATMAAANGSVYSKEYWDYVRNFLSDAVHDIGMDLVPAWQEEKFGVIHARIIENIKSMRVMIGVIIGHNANVMLECGMRLWTDKPILLIAEEDVTIPFDIKPIECLSFPKDREYNKMTKLRTDVGAKIKAMLAPGYHTFKSHFNIEADSDEMLGVTKIKLSQFMIDTKNEIQFLKMKLQAMERSPKVGVAYADGTLSINPIVGPVGGTVYQKNPAPQLSSVAPPAMAVMAERTEGIDKEN